jgi:dihydroorotase
MLTLIKGGRVIDPGNLDSIMDILIEDGKIVEVKEQRSEVRGRKSEVRGRKSEVGSRKSEVGSQRSEVGGQRSEVGGQSSKLKAQSSKLKVIDASGKIVTPGLIDMHVHFREPGHEYKETIKTGCMAAAFGGFAAVCTMPNTNPVNDNSQVTEYILKKAGLADLVRVYPVAAISPGLQGKGLCEYGE